MQDTPTRARERAGRRDRPAVPLSVTHAEALYRPRPPVGYDDEGYPFEDSKLSESTAHDDVLTDFKNAAIALLFTQPDAMVQRNLLILFEEGNRRAVVEPDVAVSLGVGRHPRNSYKLWVEGKPPDLAIEGLSEKNWRRDVDVKPALYRDLGVREFWQVDPLGRLSTPIAGYRLGKGVYRPIQPSASGAFRSEVLYAELSYDRKDMRIVDLRTGELVPPFPQVLQMTREAIRERDQATRERDEAIRWRDEANREREAEHAAFEARIAELEARLKRTD